MKIVEASGPGNREDNHKLGDDDKRASITAKDMCVRALSIEAPHCEPSCTPSITRSSKSGSIETGSGVCMQRGADGLAEVGGEQHAPRERRANA